MPLKFSNNSAASAGLPASGPDWYAGLIAQPAPGYFSIITPLTSVENLTARRDTLATNHAQLLQELAEIRATEPYTPWLKLMKPPTKPTSPPTVPILQAERARLTTQQQPWK